jgi:hypothetical protein
MDKKSQIAILIGVVVIVFAALAVGVGVKRILSRRSEATDPKLQVQRQETKAAVEVAPEDQKPTDISEEDEEFLRWVYEKMAEEEEAKAEAEEEDTSQDEPKVAVVEEEVAPAEEQGRTARRFGDWRNIWSDLNLTEEQQEKLREGFRLAMERWQNMTDEEREDEMERMREQGEKWQNMTDEERDEAMSKIREQFEDWLDSDEVELPEFSLD